MKIALDHIDIAKMIACKRKTSDPKYAAQYIKGNESLIMHSADTSDKRRKSSDDRHKTRYDNGLAAMPFVKGLGTQQMLSIEKQ